MPPSFGMTSAPRVKRVRCTGRAGQGIGQDNARTGALGGREGEKATKVERPLNPTQGGMRAAWTLSRTGEQLTEALAARGIGLAQVTVAEAAANHRARSLRQGKSGRLSKHRTHPSSPHYW
jgi:hypothetical protein